MTSARTRAWPRRLARLVVLFFGLLVVFVGALTAVYALPQQRLVFHASESLEDFKEEGVYPRPVLDHWAYTLDNYVDALMVDTAIVSPGEGAFTAAMAAKNGGEREPLKTISGLEATVSDPGGVRNPYAYYWHGYQVFLRPALTVLDHDQIRYVNIVGLSLLFGGLAMLLQRVSGARAAAALLVSVVVVGGFVVPLAVQFTSMFYIAGFASIAVVWLWERGVLDAIDVELFLAVGMVTAFLDLLTAPQLTLGMPLVVLIVLEVGRGGGTRMVTEALRVVRLSVAWAVGYVACWVTKWALATVVLKQDVFGLAVHQLRYRTGTDGAPGQLATALRRPLEDLVPFVDPEHVGRLAPLAVLIAVVVAAFLLFAFSSSARRTAFSVEARRVAPVLLVVPLPFMWFVVANNHTSIHHWFVYRILAPAIFAAVYFTAACVAAVFGAADAHRAGGQQASPAAQSAE